VKRIASLPLRSLISMSPYQPSRYVPAYFAGASDGFDAASRDAAVLRSAAAVAAAFRVCSFWNASIQSNAAAPT